MRVSDHSGSVGLADIYSTGFILWKKQTKQIHKNVRSVGVADGAHPVGWGARFTYKRPAKSTQRKQQQ